MTLLNLATAGTAVTLGALILVSCGGDVGNERNEGVRKRSQRSAAERRLTDGPLAGIRMTAGIDARGKPRRAGVVFAPSELAVTAVVPLRDVPSGSTLEVTWYRVDGPGAERKLFTHAIRVEPFRRAFSVGVAKGSLAAGDYLVTASLGEYEVFTSWKVSGAAATTGEPPAPGDSGLVDPDPWGPGRISGCSGLLVNGEYIVVIVEAQAMGMGDDCGPITLSASIKGPPVVVGKGPNLAQADFIPCELPGGTDAPGTVINLTGVRDQRPNEPERRPLELVDANEEGPFINLLPTPESGSRVKPGQEIKFEVWVVEYAPAPGIRAVKVFASGKQLLEETYDKAPPCDQSGNYKFLRGSYVVPENPPPLIELRAEATDFAGRTKFEVARFPTGEIWEGTITAKITMASSFQACIGTYKANLTLSVAAGGKVSGQCLIVEAPPNSCGGGSTYAIVGSKSPISGVLSDSTFTFSNAPFAQPVPAPAVIPRTGDRARGSATAEFNVGPDQKITSVLEFDLRCKTCGKSP